jgi:hypothetical protein
LRRTVTVEIATPESRRKQVAVGIENHSSIRVLSIVAVEGVNRLLVPTGLLLHEFEDGAISDSVQAGGRCEWNVWLCSRKKIEVYKKFRAEVNRKELEEIHGARKVTAPMRIA